MGALREVLFVVIHLTLTDPLRIQPWSQDKTEPNQIKPGTISEIKKARKADRRNGQESSQQRTSSLCRKGAQKRQKIK